MRHVSIGLGISMTLAACGSPTTGDDEPVDCSIETRADTFSVGLEKVGPAGNLDFKLMSATPAPPMRGDNTWIVQINSMASGVVGAPVTGVALTALPYMPDHQHGTPIEVVVTEMPEAGQYKLSPVNLWMPGYWETTIHGNNAGSTDTAIYKFCIPQ